MHNFVHYLLITPGFLPMSLGIPNSLFEHLIWSILVAGTLCLIIAAVRLACLKSDVLTMVYIVLGTVLAVGAPTLQIYLLHA